MTPTVEQVCDLLADRKILPTSEVSRLRARWFRPDRPDVANLDRFGKWLTVNGFLSAFSFQMLRAGQVDLLQLNQYLLVDQLSSGPFAGSYLASDPVGRRVVLDVLSAERASNPAALRDFQAAAEQAMSVRQANVSLTLDYGEAQGRHYLVREYEEGETLADILARRGKLQPVPAARLFALALLGVQALHDKQVPAGPLTPECLLLAVATRQAGGKAHTVKILNAGVPRSFFDPAALAQAATSQPGSDIGPGPAAVAPSRPDTDLFHLGITCYRTVTGQLPFAREPAEGPFQRATPIRQVAPEVPEMLAQLVESLLDSESGQRPPTAAHAAKRLRIFLASEEEAQAGPPEERLVRHEPAPIPVPEPDEEEIAEEASPTARTAHGEGRVGQQVQALWEELRPSQRDWAFLSIGAVAVVAVVLLLALLTGIRFVNVVCLLTGGALSFFVERLLRWREEQVE
jgi:serine/threonine protein kinase